MPAQPSVRWERELLRAGLGGIAATERYVLLGDRDPEDLHDVWRCFDAQTGKPLWDAKTFAIAALDYGNSPRATPLIIREMKDGRALRDSAILLGATGALLCVNLADGEVRWQKNLPEEFGAIGERPWGYCGSPLLVDDKLIVNPGAPEASLVALDPETGDVLWKAAGGNVGYGSFAAGKLGGKSQIVGYDAKTLGGWDIETGQRLWTLKPQVEGDFNVPTPIIYQGKLLVATENNGTRLYAFDSEGRIRPEADAENRRLKPNMSTPVMAGGLLFCVDRFLYCLDAANGLKERWRMRDAALGDYAAILAGKDRLLIVGKGEILLVDAKPKQRVISRWKVFDENVDVYSHAALVGDTLYVRGESSLKCLSLR